MFSSICHSCQFYYPENLTPCGWALKSITENGLGRVGMVIFSSVCMSLISGFRQPILLFLKTLKSSLTSIVSWFKPLPLLFYRVCWIKMVREPEGWEEERGRKMRHWAEVTEPVKQTAIDLCSELHSGENNWNPLCQVHSVEIPLKSS